MKVARNTKDTLIIKSRGWWIFALLVCFFLTTPFLIWITLHIGDWRWVLAAAFGPLIAMVAYRQSYHNWQIVLEADYGTAAIYSGRWLERQRTRKFPLETLDEAIHFTKEIEYRNRNFQKRTRKEHWLQIKRVDGQHKINVGLGMPSKVWHMARHINEWLAKARREQRIAADDQGSPVVQTRSVHLRTQSV